MLPPQFAAKKKAKPKCMLRQLGDLHELLTMYQSEFGQDTVINPTRDITRLEANTNCARFHWMTDQARLTIGNAQAAAVGYTSFIALVAAARDVFQSKK